MTSNSARRLTTRALKRALQLTDPAVTAAMLITVGLWATDAGPESLANTNLSAVLLYAVAILGARTLVGIITRIFIDLIDPDRWDGDSAFETSRRIAELRADIDNGADIDEVLAGLRDSNLVPELLATLRALGAGFASRGDDAQSQRLALAVEHLRNADKNIRTFHSTTAMTEAGSKTAGTPK
ncbi:hypothetical protein [Streptomyces sp. NPDC054975]